MLGYDESSARQTNGEFQTIRKKMQHETYKIPKPKLTINGSNKEIFSNPKLETTSVKN